MHRIVLIGYMGAGKTTVGRMLAKDMGLMFYDLDWYITSRMRRTVAQIFEESGEEGFRRIERNMLHEVAEFENVVISCGGGTPCFFDNMDYLNLQSEMGKSVRPLLLNKTPEEVEAFVKQQLQQREPYYSKAKHVLDVNVLDSRDKVRVSVRKIRRMLKCCPPGDTTEVGGLQKS